MSSHVDANVARAIAALTAIHDDHPVHRRRDLLARGIPDMLQVAMIRRGQLVRLRHGIYTLASLVADADAAERHRIDLAAALAATHEPSWGFGASAALLHGFPLPFVVPARLSVVRGSGLDERGLRQPSRHRLNLPEADVTTGPIEVGCTTIVRGVATVGPDLAALSTAATLSSSRWRTALFDAALWTGGTAAEIERLVEMWRHLGHRSEVLASLARARWGAQTVLETFSRLALLEQGIPEPMLQHPFADDRGPIGVVDMWWPELGVIGEADGAVKYQSREDLLREKVREDRLRALGWAVVRWTFPDIEERPQLVAASIRRARRVAA